MKLLILHSDKNKEYGNKIMSQYNSSVLHRETFCGKPTTGKRIEWDEVAIRQFDEDGMITEMSICARI